MTFQTEHDLSQAARESRGRIWVDGCFDFAHHGHAGAMLQARRLGTELLVGIHSDEEITANKGPTVMELGERIAAVEACRWSTVSVPNAPYVTQLIFIDKYNCKYVVHGDDITSDAGGEDCYRFVKAAGRFLVVKRTPGISTTDLVGRMLLGTRGHHIKSLLNVLEGKEDTPRDVKAGDEQSAVQMKTRIEEYASDGTGLSPKVQVWAWREDVTQSNGERGSQKKGPWHSLVEGSSPRPGQRLVYVDGAFDLFCSGHIEFLKQVVQTEEGLAKEAPAYVVVGVHSDEDVNQAKGANYPVMNMFERALCVLQCKYVDAVLFDAPRAPTEDVLKSLPFSVPVSAVYRGPPRTSQDAKYPAANGRDSREQDPSSAAKSLGVFVQLGPHPYQDVNAAQIVWRIMYDRDRYEERQRKKGFKAVGEEETRRKQLDGT